MSRPTQSPLEPLAEEIFELTTLSWRARPRHGDSKSEIDLSESEFLALDTLAKREPLTVGEIQRQIGVLPAQMSRVIRALEAKFGQPLIVCSINPADKRCVDVRLSEAGRKAHSSFRTARLAHTVEMLGAMSESDRVEFMRLLRIIRSSMTAQVGAIDSQKI